MRSGMDERERLLGTLRRDHWELSNDEIEQLADALTEEPTDDR